MTKYEEERLAKIISEATGGNKKEWVRTVTQIILAIIGFLVVTLVIGIKDQLKELNTNLYNHVSNGAIHRYNGKD